MPWLIHSMVKHGIVEIFKPKISRNVGFYELVEKNKKKYNIITYLVEIYFDFFTYNNS